MQGRVQYSRQATDGQGEKRAAAPPETARAQGLGSMPANSMDRLFWGEGEPLALLSMSYSLLGGRGTPPPAREGFPFPPSPLSLPQRAFIRGKSRDAERIALQDKWD